MSEAMLIVQRDHLHVRVRFQRVENLTILILFGTFFIDKFVKEKFSMKQCFFPFSSAQVRLFQK